MRAGFPIPLRVVTLTGSPVSQHRGREPLTIGLPMAPGQCRPGDNIVIRDGTGSPLPIQTQVTDQWPDGSARWLVLDTYGDGSSGGSELIVDAGPAPEAPGPAVISAERPEGVDVDTGAAKFTIGRSGRDLFTRIQVSGREPIDCAHTGFRLENAAGSQTAIAIEQTYIELSGPVRTVVCVQATARLDDLDLEPVRTTCRLHFFAGSSALRIAVTLHNPRRAMHPGGFWDLGDAGSVLLRDFSFVTTLRSGAAASGHYSANPDAPSIPFSSSLQVYQDSSGGANYRSSNHIDSSRNIPITFRGYRERIDTVEGHGDRATPVVTLTDGTTSVSCGMQHFWQNFPKSIEAADGRITLRLFPKQSAGLHEIQGGEQKTHVFAIAIDEGAHADTLQWVRDPVCAVASPEYYCGTGAISYLVPRAQDRNRDYLTLVDAALDGPDSFINKREVVDEYGWRHFGEIYGDHESVRHEGPGPLVSHYNNQYDPIAGFTYQFLRSGDPRWLAQMLELAAHVVDIDIYHTDLDKAGYNHGLFWHTCHYIDADTSTHRSYPRAAAHLVPGGGPSCEHLYTTGLMLHYFMTGDTESRDAVVNMARLVVDVDDGSKSVMRWLSRTNTGWASASGSFGYHGPGRGPGNAINALVDAHRLTRSAEVLDKAEQLIRRCVHPQQDLDALNLLDAERRWYYTMFLQALGKYLDHKAELGQLDAMYAYGRDSLLHYARWMAVHEYPILDKPAILEFPTETWAAQDMRKSEVFKYAAQHSSEPERTRFLERADYFFTESTRRLVGMPTHTLARPVVLLLSYGFMHAWVQQNPSFSAPTPGRDWADFGGPTTFIPQRLVAKRRVMALAAAALVTVVAGVSFLLL